jgi:hypothetical protein
VALSDWPSLEDVRLGARFVFGTQRVLRQPVTATEAQAALADRLTHRAENFLGVVREAVYANPDSPYLGLLRRIGCEHGDLERLVRAEGIEGALATLFRQGVYLTVDEAKGRTAIVRGSATIPLGPNGLRYPRSVAGLQGRTNGSRGQRTTVPISFASIRSHAMENLLDIGAWENHQWIHARWGMPGSATLSSLIRYQLCGLPVEQWFSLLDPAAAGVHPRYAWSERALRLSARLAGVSLPQTVHVPLGDPLPIVRWMADQLRAGRTPCLRSYVSPVAHLCQSAYEAGISLRGAVVAIGGEPWTEARRTVIERVGVEISLHYATTESGNVGRGCLAPEAPDEVHLGHDRLALIQPGEAARAVLPTNAVL